MAIAKTAVVRCDYEPCGEMLCVDWDRQTASAARRDAFDAGWYRVGIHGGDYCSEDCCRSAMASRGKGGASDPEAPFLEPLTPAILCARCGMRVLADHIWHCDRCTVQLCGRCQPENGEECSSCAYEPATPAADELTAEDMHAAHLVFSRITQEHVNDGRHDCASETSKLAAKFAKARDLKSRAGGGDHV